MQFTIKNLDKKKFIVIKMIIYDTKIILSEYVKTRVFKRVYAYEIQES